MSETVFEDDLIKIVINDNAVTLGHLKIYPKTPYKSLEEMPKQTVGHMFAIASRCASLLFDALQAEGTNIILNNGKNANQVGDSICVDVIARKDGDGLGFAWEPKQGDQQKIQSAAKDISSKIIVGEPPKQVAFVKPPTIKVHADEDGKTEEGIVDKMIEQLQRLP